jgi:protocatechuate 3,4-dioxygenase beta subunit
MRARSGRAVGMVCLAAFVLAWPGRAEAGRVRGAVVDREGKPAAGAHVRVAKLGFMEPLQVHEGAADGSGAFDVEVPAGDWVVYALRGDEGGRADWDSIAKVGDGKEPKPVTIRLWPPSKLRGRLLDAETGEPITKGQFALNDARRVEVDAQGRFEARGLEMTNHEAYPLCPGYERRRILFDTTGRPDAELELKLPRAGKVVGRVTDLAGKPVAGASVGLRTSGSIFSGSALWETCSDDGRFVYDGRPLGRTGRLSARAPGYQDQEREDVVAIDPSTPAEFNFTLRPEPAKGALGRIVGRAIGRRTVSGTVVGPGGKPVAATVVRWGLQTSSDSVPETKTDEKGAFRLEGVPDEENVLSVMAKGLAPGFPNIVARGDQQVKVELKAGATIRGRVVDDGGNPIEGVRVIAQVNNPRPNWMGFVYLDELQAKTDRDGRFILEGMPEGVKCDVVVERWSAVRQRALSPADESKNVITLLGDGAIRGRVVDPTGKPVRNFRIQVGIPKAFKPGDPAGGYFAGYSGTGLSFTRDDGEFTISGLTAGHLHRLTVIADGFGVADVDRVESQSINRLKPAGDLTIALQSPYDLRVFVYREGGKPLEGARVTVIQSEGQGGGFHWGYSESSWDDSVTARASAEGWAEFPFLAFGKGTVVVRAKGYSRAKLDWAKEEEEFKVFLQPESRLAGTVLDEAGHPVPGAKATLSWGSGEMMNVPIDAKDGRYSADGLAPGKYILAVGTGGVPGLFSGPVDLEPGKTLSRDIRVKNPAGRR